MLGLAGNTGNSTNAHLDLTFKAKSGHGGRYNTFFDSLHFLDHHRRRALEKHAYQGPKLQVDSTSPVALKNMPDGVDGTVMAQPEVWYDIVGQAADNWWQIVVPHGKPNQEDVGWVAVADDRKIKGELTWVHNTDPELTDPDVLRPPNAPPTMLRSFSYIPGIHTLTWAAPAADGITGYRIQSSTGGNPVTAVADTGSTATQWISSAVEPCYRVFYRVAALRGNPSRPMVEPLACTIDFFEIEVWGNRGGAGASNTCCRSDGGDLPAAGRPAVLSHCRAASGEPPLVADPAAGRESGLGPGFGGHGRGDLAAVQGWAPELRVSSWVTLGLHLRSGPGKAYDPPLQTLRDHGVWHRIVGKDATHPTWWRIRVSTNSHGWVHAGHVDTRGDLSGVPVQDAASPLPAETGSSGEAAQGTSTTSGAASGPYRNLETNPEGRWSVTKTGTEVTARFSSPRSPVQYYARQNPQPQFVLPVGFRPTVAKCRTKPRARTCTRTGRSTTARRRPNST